MTERSADQIRKDMEVTRAEMDQTVDALQQKLSPNELVGGMWRRMKRDGGAAANLGDMVREHPVPIALMGLGLGWLAIERATASRETEDRSFDVDDPDRDTGYASRRRPRRLARWRDKAASTVERVKDSASHAAETAKDKASELADRARDTMADRGERSGDRMSAARRRMAEETRRRAEQLERGFTDMLEDHPLALGALAFGAGLAVGVSVPTSRLEDRVMGEASDSLKEEAREVADRAKSVARDTAATAKDEFTGAGHDLADRVEKGLDRARETGERRAREEGLTPEGLGQRASERAHPPAARPPNRPPPPHH